MTAGSCRPPRRNQPAVSASPLAPEHGVSMPRAGPRKTRAHDPAPIRPPEAPGGRRPAIRGRRRSFILLRRLHGSFAIRSTGPSHRAFSSPRSSTILGGGEPVLSRACSMTPPRAIAAELLGAAVRIRPTGARAAAPQFDPPFVAATVRAQHAVCRFTTDNPLPPRQAQRQAAASRPAAGTPSPRRPHLQLDRRTAVRGSPWSILISMAFTTSRRGSRIRASCIEALKHDALLLA